MGALENVGQFLAKYAEVNPEGHGTLVAQSMMRDLMDNRVPMSLEMSTVLLDDLGATRRVIAWT